MMTITVEGGPVFVSSLVAIVRTARIGAGGRRSKIVGGGSSRGIGVIIVRIAGRQKGARREPIETQQPANQVAKRANATVILGGGRDKEMIRQESKGKRKRLSAEFQWRRAE